jgi:hypothetical protein
VKLVVVKKGAKKWTAAKLNGEGICCLSIESAYWPCFEIGLNG